MLRDIPRVEHRRVHWHTGWESHRLKRRPDLADLDWEMLSALQALELLRAQQSYARWVGSRMAMRVANIAAKHGIDHAVEVFADETWRLASLRAFQVGETWRETAVARAMQGVEKLIFEQMGVA